MLLTETLHPFLDKVMDREEADYILFASPLDKTTSNRKGTRFAPINIRRESAYFDTYSIRTGLDWEDLKLCDIGDLAVSNLEESLSNIIITIDSILPKFPVMIGGEHTITLGALRSIKPDLLIVFDAHLDLRDELFNEKLCHATYLRRIIEEQNIKAVVIGVRALSKEEVRFADYSDQVSYITANHISNNGLKLVIDSLIKEMNSVRSAYLSIDMDVLDPAYAPAVGNPHPEGLTTTCLMDIIEGIMSKKIKGMDINEIYPHFDKGQTSITAGYIIMESLYAHIQSR
jgi:agmatinase